MPHKKSTLSRHSQRLLSLGAMLMVVVAVVFYGSQLLTSHAATGTYTCNTGDTLMGTSCTHVTSYAAHSNGAYYYCSTGDTLVTTSNNCTHTYTLTYGYICKTGYTLTGTVCTHTYSATATYSCNSGDTLSGSTCYHYYLRTNFSCNTGDTVSPTGQCQHTYAATVKYSCPNGGTPSGSTCTQSYPATLSYTCSTGDTLINNTTCQHIYGAFYQAVTYTCNTGDTLNNMTCVHTLTYAATFRAAAVKGNGTSGNTGGAVTITPALPPGAPTNLKATIKSGKVVSLSWDAGLVPAGIREYDIDRSTDKVTWTPLTTLTSTAYDDTTTDFSTIYYYRVKAVDATGASSDYTTVQAKTGRFSGAAGAIASDDKLVSVKIPGDAFDQTVDCSVTGSDSGLPTVPTKSLLVGPYDVLCVATNGSIISSFKKPMEVTIKVSGAAGYDNYEVRLFDNKSSSVAKSSYDSKTRTVSFSLAANKTFAIYGTKKKSAVTTVVQSLLVAILVAGMLGGMLFLRRRRGSTELAYAEVPAVGTDTAVGALPVPLSSVAAQDPTSAFEQAVNRPACTHLSMAHQVQPQSAGCGECTAEHKHWKGLRICLTCGHVGCSDDSDEQHALKHYQQTGHPLIYEYGNPTGDTIGWCYIDQTYI